MKGCLVHGSNTSSCTASPPSPQRPHVKRKCVSFCESSESEEHEKVEVYVADDWDRTPCEVTPKLSHRDILELYEMKLSVPRSSSNRTGFDPKLPILLGGVPVALLPLLSDDAPTPLPRPSGATSSTTLSSAPPSSPQPPLESSNSRFKFLPLMPLKDESYPSAPSNPQPSSRPLRSPARPGLRNFQILPIYSVEHQTNDMDNYSHDSDHEYSISSPTSISTPSLTASSDSSAPSTPSVSPSPLVMPPISYFDLPSRQQRSPGYKADPNRMKAAGVNMADGDAQLATQYFKKMTLKAVPGRNPPPSPFELQGLQGSIGNDQYLGERMQQQEDKLKPGQIGRRKETVRRFYGTGGDDDIDEPFFSFEKQDKTHATSIPASRNAGRRSSTELRSPSPVLVPFCKRDS